MAGRCVKYRNVYSPATGGMVRRCAQFAGGGLLGGLEGAPALGQANSLRATFGDVKDVAITASIGAGGAIVTDIIFDQLTKHVETLAGLTGYTRALAEAAVGIALGVVVGKFLKRPRLGAKLAMGPVVLAVLRIAGELLNAGPYAGDRSLGMMSVDPYQQPRLSGPAPDLGAMQIGTGTPAFMLNNQATVAPAGVISSAFAA